MGDNNNTPSIHFTFCKAERLCRNTLIEQLFRSKFVIRQFPFFLSYLPAPLAPPYPAQVLIVVSKKRFKKAVHRNYIKRLCRETYRLNKHLLYEVLQRHQVTCAIGLTYTASEKRPVADLTKAFINLVSQLDHELGKITI